MRDQAVIGASGDAGITRLLAVRVVSLVRDGDAYRPVSDVTVAEVSESLTAGVPLRWKRGTFTGCWRGTSSEGGGGNSREVVGI